MTEFGQILPGAGDAAHHGLAAELALGANLARHARHFAGKGVELVDHRIDGVFQLENFAAHVHRDLARQVAAGDGGGDFGDIAHLPGQVRRHRIHRIGQVLPSAGDAEHIGLAAKAAVGAHFARDARHFAGEGVELIDHRIDGFFQLQNLAGDVDRDLFRQVAAGNGGGDVGDVADLGGQIAGHEVDAVGEILPSAGDARHRGLAAELAFGSDFAGDAGDFGGERIELVHHRIDGVFELENFAAHVDRDLARQVAARHSGGDMRDVADLVGQVAAHGVDRVGQILPGAGDARHDGLAAELAVGADLARHAGDFRGEGAQLIDHRIDGLLELQNLAAHVDRDLLRQVAVRHRNRHLGDIAHLCGQVRRHGVDALGQILPHAGDAADLRLAAELALGADLTRDARHFGREHVELLDHRVDDLGRAQELALQRPAVDVELHGLQQIALRHRGDGAGHFRSRPEQIVDQRIDARFHFAPGAVVEAEPHTLLGAAVAADHLPDPLELPRHALVGGDDLIECIGDLADDADAIAGHAHREIADPHRLHGVEQFRQVLRVQAVSVGVAVEMLCDLIAGSVAVSGDGRRWGQSGRTVGACRANGVFSGPHKSLRRPAARCRACGSLVRGYDRGQEDRSWRKGLRAAPAAIAANAGAWLRHGEGRRTGGGPVARNSQADEESPSRSGLDPLCLDLKRGRLGKVPAKNCSGKRFFAPAPSRRTKPGRFGNERLFRYL